MTTKDKVHQMFYKAAAARSLNSKIMQKRAEIANRPSDAYLAGFCKTAADMGVDPEELLKLAGFGDWLSDKWNKAKGLASSAWNGAKAVGGTVWNGAKNFGSNLAQGMSAPVRGLMALGAGAGAASTGGNFMDAMKSNWNQGKNQISNAFGVGQQAGQMTGTQAAQQAGQQAGHRGGGWLSNLMSRFRGASANAGNWLANKTSRFANNPGAQAAPAPAAPAAPAPQPQA